MPTNSFHPEHAPITLTYDDLPDGSVLRREYDGRGGVTIWAPAGDVPASVRRAAGRAGLAPASAAMALCLLLFGSIVAASERGSRLDPSLRTAAWVTLGVLCGGVFFFVWLTGSIRLTHALADARRRSTVLHASRAGILVEASGAPLDRSLEIPAASIQSFHVARASADRAGQVAIACLRVQLCDGVSHDLLPGHHLGELRWAAAALSDATGARFID